MEPGETGYLTIQKPWPSMLRTIYGDDERYVREYWNRIPGVYFAGDAAQCDKDGYIWVLGPRGRRYQGCRAPPEFDGD